MTRVLSKDRTRMVDDAPALALAAYKVDPLDDDGTYQGVHVGIFESAKDAEAWLADGEPQPKRITPRVSS